MVFSDVLSQPLSFHAAFISKIHKKKLDQNIVNLRNIQVVSNRDFFFFSVNMVTSVYLMNGYFIPGPSEVSAMFHNY